MPNCFRSFSSQRTFLIFFQLSLIFHLFLFSSKYFGFTLYSYLTCQRSYVLYTLSSWTSTASFSQKLLSPLHFVFPFYFFLFSFFLSARFIAFLLINCSFHLLPIFSLMFVCFSFTLSLSHSLTRTQVLYSHKLLSKQSTCKGNTNKKEIYE